MLKHLTEFSCLQLRTNHRTLRLWFKTAATAITSVLFYDIAKPDILHCSHNALQLVINQDCTMQTRVELFTYLWAVGPSEENTTNDIRVRSLAAE